MRDKTTIEAALTLAETGHLTFATLHTSDAVRTVSRIIGAFPPNEQTRIRAQLAMTLETVFCQQLVPWKNKSGRSLAAEILVATPAVRSMIRENKLHQVASVIQTGAGVGMKTMAQSLRELCSDGKIDIETEKAYSIDSSMSNP
jgi:twitching motility protein PilT